MRNSGNRKASRLGRGLGGGQGKVLFSPLPLGKNHSLILRGEPLFVYHFSVSGFSLLSVKSLLLELKKEKGGEMSIHHRLLSWEDRKHQKEVYIRCFGHNKYMVFFLSTAFQGVPEKTLLS